MLGCLNVKDSCTIKIKTKDIETCNSLINDILSKRVVWLSSSIYFEENNVIFELGIQTFENNSHCEEFKYTFKTTNILVE